LTSEPPLAGALDVLLRFGTLMLRSGDAAFRVDEAMRRLAPRLGIDDFTLLVTVTGLTASARRGEQSVTLLRPVGPLGINAWRLGALERLSGESTSTLTPAALHAELDAIERTPPLQAPAVVALAVGLASGAFSWLNGGNPAEGLAAFAAGAVGQFLRASLFARHLNQYAVTAFCAMAAAACYCAAAALLARAGAAPGHGIGLIAAVLFLVPGFPLVAALLDLLQHQTLAGLVRLAYGTTLLLAAAFGLGLIVAVAGFATPAPQLPHAADLFLTLLWRGVASFLGGCGFAVLYNSSHRTVLTVGVLALLGNEVRLALQDAGALQAAATFAGALIVGLLASLAPLRLNDPRIALTVPGIIIMVPGSYAFQSIVLFNQGDVLGGLQMAVLAGFVVGAMALGLATARFVSERKWLVES
jgi:uncharacterized membrane protein YjjP (DUF1212 family)